VTQLRIPHSRQELEELHTGGVARAGSWGRLRGQLCHDRHELTWPPREGLGGKPGHLLELWRRAEKRRAISRVVQTERSWVGALDGGVVVVVVVLKGGTVRDQVEGESSRFAVKEKAPAAWEREGKEGKGREGDW
jgi:hypothetical protein